MERSISVCTKPVLEIDEEFFTGALRVDKYRLISKLGAGGMGEVWKARHRLLARPAAIKLIRADCTNKEEEKHLLLQRFQREAQVIAELQSPNTIKLYDYGVTEGQFYYVMELLEGMDLKYLVTEFGPFPSERVVMLLKQACRSLMEAHEIEVIHRDIKGQNLFVCKLGIEYDFLKVLDFGIAKYRGKQEDDLELTQSGHIIGSPQCMAPELATGSKKCDERSDIYALGCVAYWMLTGKDVFSATNIMTLLMLHVSKIPAPPSSIEVDIHEDLEKIVLSCLEKNPENRPQSVSELYQSLDAIHFESPWTQAEAKKWWEERLEKMISTKKNKILELRKLMLA